MVYEYASTYVLASMSAKVWEPVCLLGEWAVHLSVNERYSQEWGHDYGDPGDIDLGFHFSGAETSESVRRSLLAKSIRAFENMGFVRTSSGMYRTHRRGTFGEAEKAHTSDLLRLRVDLVVDKIPDAFRDAMGFQPASEPLLKAVFEKGQYDEIDKFGARMILPKPAVLLAIKIAALPSRKGRARHGDIADICALIWYSGAALDDLKSGVLDCIAAEDVRDSLLGVSGREREKAAGALGIDEDSLKTVIAGFAAGCANMARGVRDGEWKMPYSVGYGTFANMLKTLVRHQADSEPVSPHQVAHSMQIGARVAQANLNFLKSVGAVAEAEPRSYKLTRLGLAYAEAHASGDKDALRQASLDVINGSHLKPLSDALAKERSLEAVYGWIKARGGYADGKSPSGMHSPHHAGARTLLHIFRDAGLPKDKLPGASLLGRLSVQGVGSVDILDADTLELAGSYLDVLRRRLESGKPAEGSSAG